MFEKRGLSIAQAARRSIAGIAAFRDHAALRAALQAEFAVAVPTTPSCIATGSVTLSCLAPARYLATGDRDANLPGRLAASLAGLAAITDQSDLWDVYILSGPDTPDTIARLVPIDLSPARFPTGALALTRAGHLDVRLWHIGDQTYELAVARSYTADLQWALQHAAPK